MSAAALVFVVLALCATAFGQQIMVGHLPNCSASNDLVLGIEIISPSTCESSGIGPNYWVNATNYGLGCDSNCTVCTTTGTTQFGQCLTSGAFSYVFGQVSLGTTVTVNQYTPSSLGCDSRVLVAYLPVQSGTCTAGLGGSTSITSFLGTADFLVGLNCVNGGGTSCASTVTGALSCNSFAIVNTGICFASGAYYYMINSASAAAISQLLLLATVLGMLLF